MFHWTKSVISKMFYKGSNLGSAAIGSLSQVGSSATVSWQAITDNMWTNEHGHVTKRPAGQVWHTGP